MKTLILSCDTGNGHNSAASALAEALSDKGHECAIADVIGFRGKVQQKLVSSAYYSIVRRTPYLFGMIYKAGDLFSKTGVTSPIYYANTLYAHNLLDYIKENDYQCIICTHLYAMEAMTYIRKHLDAHIPSFAVLTDYTCVPFFSEVTADGYFVPTPEAKQECILRGIDEEKIYTLGIPVHKRFAARVSKEEARRQLDIPPQKTVYLVMTGGVGCKNMIALCKRLVKSAHGDFIVYAFSGKNKALKKQLSNAFKGSDKLVPISFTTKVNLYMNAADVLISKAGGISSSEAAVSRTPLVHTMNIPGCETANAKYFSQNGMSICASTANAAVTAAVALAQDEQAKEQMQLKQAVINPNSSSDIIEKVISLCQ